MSTISLINRLIILHRVLQTCVKGTFVQDKWNDLVQGIRAIKLIIEL